jgi:hypothetical protein
MSEKIKQEGDFKIKKKPKKLINKDKITKVDLSKKEKEEDAVQEQTTDEVLVQDQSGASKEVPKEDVKETTEEPTKKEEVKSPLEEVIEEKQEEKEQEAEVVAEEKAPEPVQEDKVNLPENIEKLVEFMNDTGGTVEDYVRLNADYSNIDNDTLIREYYKQTKPHLDRSEVDFLLEDNFSFDEEVDEERDIKKKKLAYKEEIAKARKFLEDTKSKYYDEIKLRPGVTQEQKRATDFFNKYNEEQKMVQQQHNKFQLNTKKFFNQEFKGFEFNVGEKKFKYNVTNTDSVASNQSDLTNLIGKFLDNKGEVKDYKGYHRAIYAAQNADTIAGHFYEQGKADAIKDMMAKSKNISNEPRQTSSGEVYINGLKVRAISGVDSSKLKIKQRTK